MFLHPAFLVLGAAAAALPVLIHWLTRPRPTRLPLSTIRFVREVVEQRRARHRLRDSVVLALRTLAVLLLAAALARPLLNEVGNADTGKTMASTVRVVLVDLSQSMAAQAGGITALERARAVAAGQLQFRAGLRTNLIFAAAQPRAVFSGPSNNFTALREALDTAAARPERLLVQPALNLAAEMLAAGPSDTRRELVIVSDFQRTNWTAADFATLPEGTVIELRSVAPAEGVGNFAILRVAAAGRSAAGQEQRLEVEVGNFSAAAGNVRVEVRLGEAAYQLAGATTPFSRTTLTTTVRPAASGWQVGEARLLDIEDALPADDVRPCVLEVPPPPNYLLITRQLASQRPSSSYYLERALAPSDDESVAGTRSVPASEGSRVVRLAADKLDNQSLAAADLLVIDHPGKLPAEAIGVLAGQIRRGRGLFYVAADASDAANLKLLADALGNSVRMPVEFQPPAASQPRRDLFLTSVRRQQPPFAIFGDELNSLTSPLRFSGGLASRRLAQGLDDDIRGTLNDGSSFLVAVASDAGSLVVLNADLERSNLAVSPLFVPLVAELTQELMAKNRSAGEFASGEPLAVAIAAAGELTLAGGPAETAERRGEIALEGTLSLWRAAAAGPPAVYEVKRGNETVAAAAVVIPPEESDLRSLTAGLLETRLAGQRDVRFHAWSPTATEQQDQIWMWLVVGCLLCVFAEFAALKWFRS